MRASAEHNPDSQALLTKKYGQGNKSFSIQKIVLHPAAAIPESARYQTQAHHWPKFSCSSFSSCPHQVYFYQNDDISNTKTEHCHFPQQEINSSTSIPSGKSCQ